MDFDFEEEEVQLDTHCPNCGKEYDAIDYEYQICYRCKHQNDNNISLAES